MFRHEEYLMSVYAELRKSSEFVNFHLMLASAAAHDNNAVCFEPFPPHFLRSNEVRARAGPLMDEKASPWNKDTHSLIQTLNGLPEIEKLSSASSEHEVKLLLAQAGDLAYKLVQFVLSTNRLLLERVPGDYELPGLGRTQYAVIQNSPAVEKKFADRREKDGSRFAFHGSPLSKWFSIVRNGLLVLSNTQFMTSGAAYGRGVYLSEHSDVSLFYCKGVAGASYGGAPFHCIRILGIVEYITDKQCTTRHHNGIVTVNDSEAVQLRYIIVYQNNNLDPVRVCIESLAVKKRFAAFQDEVVCGRENMKRFRRPQQ